MADPVQIQNKEEIAEEHIANRSKISYPLDPDAPLV